MRYLPRLVTGLLAILFLSIPCASHAYSEWPSISSHAMELSREENIPLQCCLESHAGNIYFPVQIQELDRFIRFMLELGHYLSLHTNAGPTYLLRVHFADHVRVISIGDLEVFRHKVKAGFNDPKVIYDFFSRFQVH